jgi:hypothetical protein
MVMSYAKSSFTSTFVGGLVAKSTYASEGMAFIKNVRLVAKSTYNCTLWTIKFKVRLKTPLFNTHIAIWASCFLRTAYNNNFWKCFFEPSLSHYLTKFKVQ